jgi:hypothetical protein
MQFLWLDLQLLQTMELLLVAVAVVAVVLLLLLKSLVAQVVVAQGLMVAHQMEHLRLVVQVLLPVALPVVVEVLLVVTGVQQTLHSPVVQVAELGLILLGVRL